MTAAGAHKIAALEFRKRSVLIVADNAGFRTIVADMCRALGFRQVDLARTPDEVFDKLQVVSFDFLLCKWHQPPVTAASFVAKLRASPTPSVKRIPLVLVGEYSRSDIAEGEGLIEILRQPFSVNALAQAFEKVIV